MNKKKYSLSYFRQGFTLLEILVVMVIIGVLVTIGLRSFTISQMRARDGKRKRDIEQIANALEMYRTDKGHYPVSDNGKIKVYYGENSEEHIFEWGDPFYDLETQESQENIYIGNLPTDPSGMRYFYKAHMLNNDGTEAQAYRIYAFLENEQDSGRVSAEDLPDGEVDCSSGQGVVCNYFISSPNLIN